MNKEIEAIIFDLDGTLVDSLADIADATNAVLKAHDFPDHAIDRYRYFVGDGIEQLMVRALPEDMRRPEVITECLAQLKATYGRNWAVKTRPYDGVYPLLVTLRHKGYALAVLSNKPDDLTADMVTHYFGDSMFDLVQGVRPGVPPKPDPTAALAMVRELSLHPEQFMFIGDSAIDLHTAINAGMMPIGVAWGFRGIDELQANGADFILHHPLDLWRYLDQSLPDIAL